MFTICINNYISFFILLQHLNNSMIQLMIFVVQQIQHKILKRNHCRLIYFSNQRVFLYHYFNLKEIIIKQAYSPIIKRKSFFLVYIEWLPSREILCCLYRNSEAVYPMKTSWSQNYLNQRNRKYKGKISFILSNKKKINLFTASPGFCSTL